MGIILNTLFFYFLLWAFGTDDSGTRGWQAFAIPIAGGIVQAICLLKFQMGPIATVLLSTGVMVMLLVGWCRTSLWSATKICACFLAGCVVYQLAIEALSSQARA